MKQGGLFDGAMEPGLICPECGFGHGHAPDCWLDFLPASVALFAGTVDHKQQGNGFRYEEPGLYHLEGETTYRFRIHSGTNDERQTVVPGGVVFLNRRTK